MIDTYAPQSLTDHHSGKANDNDALGAAAGIFCESPIIGADTWRDRPPASNAEVLRLLQAWRRCGAFSESWLRSRAGSGIVPLSMDPIALIDRLADFGRVRMALIHNHGGMIACGRISDARHRKHRSTITCDGIDTRLRHHQWGGIYAVGGRLPGVYVVDKQQQLCIAWLLHKGSRSRAFAALCADGGINGEPMTEVTVRKRRQGDTAQAISKELGQTLLKQWGKLVDTHQFGPLLSRLRLSPLQAYSLAEGIYTRRVPVARLTDLSHALYDQQCACMVFMENEAGILIHCGILRYHSSTHHCRSGTIEHGEHCWHNDSVHHLWMVTRPTREGDVVSVEAFDMAGKPVVKVFGVRSWKKPEDPRWQPLIKEVCGLAPCPSQSPA